MCFFVSRYCTHFCRTPSRSLACVDDHIPWGLALGFDDHSQSRRAHKQHGAPLRMRDPSKHLPTLRCWRASCHNAATDTLVMPREMGQNSGERTAIMKLEIMHRARALSKNMHMAFFGIGFRFIFAFHGVFERVSFKTSHQLFRLTLELKQIYTPTVLTWKWI